jgi:uncharacterized repeat protein (TIGR03803 family)
MRSVSGPYGNGYNKQLYVEGLMQRRDRIFGKLAVAALALAIVCGQAAWAQTFATLYSFCSKSGCTDGSNPEAGLVQGTNGNFYGTTASGGNNGPSCNGLGCGTVFKITPTGQLTTLYSFCSQSGCADGFGPDAGLIQASNGDFYGTTRAGGVNPYGGNGTVFKITPDGTPTAPLYSFCVEGGACLDGANPTAGLVQATNGDLYGTTTGFGGYGAGTVYKITPDGALTTLNSFDTCCGRAGLIQATNGDLYGTTSLGESGSVFKTTPSYVCSSPPCAPTTLYNFCSLGYPCADGAAPLAALVQAADGNFYGTTNEGGSNDACYPGPGCGTVFKITPDGTPTAPLYSFCMQSGCTDGEYPAAALVQATNGNFYGTTASGGANNRGTIFEITPTGTLTTLYSFCPQSGCADGAAPYAALIQGTNGSLYGTTSTGGAHGSGTVFSLAVDLRPFVEAQPAAGKVGAAVRILGSDLSGATSVRFNGTTAVFEVESRSLITTTVPAGATTGEVKVVTPLGTLTSNVPFRVRP